MPKSRMSPPSLDGSVAPKAPGGDAQSLRPKDSEEGEGDDTREFKSFPWELASAVFGWLVAVACRASRRRQGRKRLREAQHPEYFIWQEFLA